MDIYKHCERGDYSNGHAMDYIKAKAVCDSNLASALAAGDKTTDYKVECNAATGRCYLAVFEITELGAEFVFYL